MRIRHYLASIFLPLAVACTSGEDPAPTVDLEAERASLLQADRAWAEAHADSDSPADAFVAQVMDEARLLPPGAPLAQGKDAIRSVIAALEAMPGFSVTWEPSSADVAAAGDLGYTIGSYEMMMAGPEGVPQIITGKYMTIWKKQPDGAWMVAADMFNADGAPSTVE